MIEPGILAVGPGQQFPILVIIGVIVLVVIVIVVIGIVVIDIVAIVIIGVIVVVVIVVVVIIGVIVIVIIVIYSSKNTRLSCNAISAPFEWPMTVDCFLQYLFGGA